MLIAWVYIKGMESVEGHGLVFIEIVINFKIYINNYSNTAKMFIGKIEIKSSNLICYDD